MSRMRQAARRPAGRGTSQLLWLALLMPALRSQDKPPSPQALELRTSATLHQAWLAEVMDLDHQRAADLYAEVAKDRQPDNLERWVATARLLELQRLGRTSAPPLAANEVPAPLRAPFAAASPPLDATQLFQRAAAVATVSPSPPPAEKPPEGTPSTPPSPDATRLPPLRPVVFEAEAWLQGQIGPSWRDRTRQRQQAPRPQFTDRLMTMRIAFAELEGRRGQADQLRELYFTQWQMPQLTAPAPAMLDRVRRNLATLQRERGNLAYPTSLLQRIAEWVEQTAQTDPAAALALVRRLPNLAESLLAETPSEGR